MNFAESQKPPLLTEKKKKAPCSSHFHFFRYETVIHLTPSNQLTAIPAWASDMDYESKNKLQSTDNLHGLQTLLTSQGKHFRRVSKMLLTWENHLDEYIPRSSSVSGKHVLLPYWAMALLSKRFSPLWDEKAGTCKEKVLQWYLTSHLQVITVNPLAPACTVKPRLYDHLPSCESLCSDFYLINHWWSPL